MAPVVAAGAAEMGAAALANPETTTAIVNAVAEAGAGDALGGASLAAGGATLAAKGEESVSKAFSSEKQALVEMAKADKKAGMTSADIQAYKELNKQLPDPFPTETVRGPELHNSGAPISQAPHGHVGPVDHIPIRDEFP